MWRRRNKEMKKMKAESGISISEMAVMKAA